MAVDFDCTYRTNVDFPAPKKPQMMVRGTVVEMGTEPTVGTTVSVSRRILRQQNTVSIMFAASQNYARNIVVLDHSVLLELINKPERFVGCERGLFSTRTILEAIVLATKRKVFKRTLNIECR